MLIQKGLDVPDSLVSEDCLFAPHIQHADPWPEDDSRLLKSQKDQDSIGIRNILEFEPVD